MYALLLATFCLLSVSTFPALADSTVPADAVLDVYLKSAEASTPDVLAEMNRELGALMQTAGFRVIWRGANDPPSTTGAEHLVIAEMRGLCVAQFSSAAARPLSASLPLAYSSVVDGKVLPFIWIDCSALNRFLAPAASNQSKTEQDYLYGRSMARLLAHELYHVLAQTDEHAPAGIAKARFSTADLLAEHLDFETVALDRLRAPSTNEGADDAPVSGR